MATFFVLQEWEIPSLLTARLWKEVHHWSLYREGRMAFPSFQPLQRIPINLWLCSTEWRLSGTCARLGLSANYSSNENQSPRAPSMLFLYGHLGVYFEPEPYEIIRNDLVKTGLSKKEAKLYTIHSFRNSSVTDMTGTDEEKMKRGGWNSVRLFSFIDVFISNSCFFLGIWAGVLVFDLKHGKSNMVVLPTL